MPRDGDSLGDSNCQKDSNNHRKGDHLRDVDYPKKDDWSRDGEYP